MHTLANRTWIAVCVAGGLALGMVACGGSSDSGGNGAGASAGAGGTGGAGDGGAGAGGSAQTGGTGGTGGTEEPIAHADKVDLLIMVDNSVSMADKQAVVAQTVPDLVGRLTNPDCFDPATGQFVAQVEPGQDCPAGSERAFPPVTDMHLGVITSSLGGHGADACSPTGVGTYNPHQEDMAHLIARTDSGGTVATYGDKGYLNWDPKGASSPPGTADAQVIIQSFGEMVQGAGEDGCGFESQLESWFRFLVDPAPYRSMVPVPCYDGDTANQCRGPDGIDAVVLQQREDFLRKDSVVAIVMLTDEDDCSVMDGGQNFLALQMYDGLNPFHLARGTAACETNPASPDCKSCWAFDQASAPPECVAGWDNADKDDPVNLRCYREKQRFGIDFLQPLSRYVAALTSKTLDDGSPNPLLATRDRSQVVLAGIVGVPWQDIARDPSDLTKGYKTASEIQWDVIAGDPQNYVDPTDPFMKPSVDPRSGTNPITGDSTSPPGAPYNANPINGHEWDIPSRADLQYACVFDLPAPRDCSVDWSCDCPWNGDVDNPLCQNPTTGQLGSVQYRAKAYPGIRHLGVLKGIGGQAVVASICAPNLTSPAAADYAYRPAIDALVRRVGKNLSAP